MSQSKLLRYLYGNIFRCCGFVFTFKCISRHNEQCKIQSSQTLNLRVFCPFLMDSEQRNTIELFDKYNILLIGAYYSFSDQNKLTCNGEQKSNLYHETAADRYIVYFSSIVLSLQTKKSLTCQGNLPCIQLHLLFLLISICNDPHCRFIIKKTNS